MYKFALKRNFGAQKLNQRVLEAISTETESINESLLNKQIDQVENLRILPIPKHPLFPRNFVKFKLDDDHFQFLMRDITSDSVGAFLRKPKADEDPKIEDKASRIQMLTPMSDISEIYQVGAYCKTSFNRLDQTILLKPQSKIQILQLAESPVNLSGLPLYSVQHLKTVFSENGNTENKKLLEELVQKLEELKQYLSLYERQQMDNYSTQFDMRHDEEFLDFVSVCLSHFLDSHKIQTVFEELNFSTRIEKLCELVNQHLRVKKQMRELQIQASEKISKYSEEIMLKEIQNLVAKKLGSDKDEKTSIRKKLDKNLEGKKVPQNVQSVIDEELERLQSTDKNSSEFQIPWGVYQEESLDLSQARKILDEDHYGMKDIKERILEFIAVTKLRNSVHGKILCFVGPAGVGKTSIGRSIARALNRKFYRVSLGGLDDVAELKGHRRTYIGSLPGKIVHAFKLTQTQNPVILIDEVDKVGKISHRGSPENSLLEILDPDQNTAFNDHYLDVPLDLSKVLFICTANWAEQISKPLLDRMDVITVPGYTELEKRKILDIYLEPDAKTRAGLESKGDLITSETKEVLIREYCREAGVRSLQKNIRRIWEILAKQEVSGQALDLVKPDNLLSYLGHSPFPKEKMYSKNPPGVVMGLAYNEIGGSVLYIEVQPVNESEKATLKITGNVKKIMEESIQISYSYARKIAKQLGNTSLEKCEIHLHVPEGSIPKDGPSAGVTITTALISLALNAQTIPDLAMTGEISLTGKVLKIGGLKEKLVAAKREGVKVLCLPESNKDSFTELDQEIKESFQVHFVDSYPEILQIAFPQMKEIFNGLQH